jgi:hypothetical protein
MEVTYSWILNNGGGVNKLSTYPWSGVRSTCRYSASNNGAVIKYASSFFTSCVCACVLQ